MHKPVLTIFYQFNPWHTTIGSIQTVISLFIKYAPSDFEVRLVETGNDLNQPMGKWEEVEFAGKALRFLSILRFQNNNVSSRIAAGYFVLKGWLVKQFRQVLFCKTELVKLYQQHYPAIAERVGYIKNIDDNEIFFLLPLEERGAGRRELVQQLGLVQKTKVLLYPENYPMQACI